MAIARVASAKQAGNDIGNTQTISSYVVASGSDRLLVSGAGLQGGPLISTVFNTTETLTWDKEQQRGGAANTANISSRIAPSVTTANIVGVMTGSAGLWDLFAANYTGCKQSSQPDSTGSADTASGTGLSYTVTTVADDCWIVTTVTNYGGTTVDGTNYTKLQETRAGIDFGDSNGSVGAAGAKTVSMTWPSGSGCAASASYAPSVPPVTTLNLSENLSTSIIERFSRLWTAPRNRSENVLLQAETTSRTWTAPRSPSDVITITETFSGIKGRIIEILETLGINESFSRSWSTARSFSESLGVTETFTRVATYVRGLTETQTITEYITAAVQIIRTLVLSEVVSIIEYVRTPLNWLKRTPPSTTWTKRTKP